MNDTKRALIIFPTYNEKENIKAIIAAALRQDPRLDALVVDDNSPDGTGRIADDLAAQNNRIHVMHRERKEGLGRAYIAGFRWGIERSYDYLFEMDADFSHGPEYLPDFLAAIENHDLVLGSRYISGVNVINWPMSRLLLSYFANVYTRVVTGLPVRDGTGGFKCFRREVLETINLDAVKSNGYIFQIEMSMRAWKKGFRIKEIPIVFVDRQKGASKMSKKIVREAIWKVWYLRLMSMLGKMR
ncbi:MAG: polyprenol monophosphomannose synthase [candidate division Zixibacteria bacterium]|nr:polyprenol monophosphomannose synthase [candidate division Zixibacteria bacterium]